MNKYFLISIVLFSGMASCKKNGVGGKAEIHAEVLHHEQPIKSSIVYIKFGAKDLPSNPESDYDLRVTGEPGENHVHIDEMRSGDYFLYAVGYDSTISEIVRGGIAVEIKWSERKEKKEVKIQVTE